MATTIMSAIKRRAVASGLLAVLSATVAAGTAAAPQQPSITEAATAGRHVAWRDCGDGLQCGDVIVPADWTNPHGAGTIIVGLVRLPARGQSTKIGTLLHNPGGPAAAIERVPQDKDRYAELTEWFDVVVFDPRGFGKSNGISCPRPAPNLIEHVSPDRAAYTSYAESNRAFAQDCARAMGSLRGNLNSWQVAHDMDAIRVALGEHKLNYFGNSYGTVFGQAYAELFGGNLARMYLDSMTDHTEPDVYDLIEPMAARTEQSLHRFAQWCARDTGCALHGSDVLVVLDRVIATAERAPIPAPGAGEGVTASASLIVTQTRGRVMIEPGWPALAEALADADAGDASAFVPPSPLPPGTFGPDLSRIMQCADFPYDTGYAAVKQIERRLRAHIAPRLGWAQAWNYTLVPCAGLPRTGTFPPHPIQPGKLPPVLLANGSNDIGSPPEHSQHLAAQLPGARSLTADGGHSLYLYEKNPCVREHVHRYLTAGELPPAGATCPAATRS